MANSTVYIDEAGDLGFQRGTQWFVLSAVVVDKQDEPHIRAKLAQIKTRLNVNEIHLRKLPDFYKRAVVVQEISEESFTYMCVIADTNKLDYTKIDSAATAYNYLCRMLLERVSWFLRDTNRVSDIVLSARGTSRDGELITYIKDRLLTYPNNQIVKTVFERITAKPAGSWDLLQLADICATTMFLTYEKNGWGFRTPCFTKVLSDHLYHYGGRVDRYGIKYFTNEMKPASDLLKCDWPCIKTERTPGATTT